MAGIGGPKTVGAIVAEVKMTRAAVRGGVILVEGGGDSRFWGARTEAAGCQSVLCGGKDNVKRATARLVGDGVGGILGVVDDDFESVEGLAPSTPNVLRTDQRDHECMLLSSPALEAVLMEVGDERKIKSFEEAEGISVREALIARALVLGKLRWLSMRQGWGVDFSQLSPFRFVDMSTWGLNVPELMRVFTSKVPGLSVDDCDRHCATLPSVDSWSVISGHDALCILAAGLRKRLGSEMLTEERVAGMLRLAYGPNHFKSTALYRGVLEWEEREGVKILRGELR